MQHVHQKIAQGPNFLQLVITMDYRNERRDHAMHLHLHKLLDGLGPVLILQCLIYIICD